MYETIFICSCGSPCDLTIIPQFVIIASFSLLHSHASQFSPIRVQSCLCHQERQEDERPIQVYRTWAGCLQNHVRVEEKEMACYRRVYRGENSSWRIIDYTAAEIVEGMHTEVVDMSKLAVLLAELARDTFL